MKKTILLFCLTFFAVSQAQEYTSSSIHSHNDYANTLPFYEAYSNEVGIIEADVHWLNNELYVAHTATEITPQATLKNLYLDPLVLKIKAMNGKPYPKNKPFTLMIDVKTEAIPTLNAIVNQLNNYPEISANPAISIIISGNRPASNLWPTYPSFIQFDGRINENYTAKELTRVAMISEDLKKHSDWNGKGVLTQPDLVKIKAVIQKVHELNKKIRFWSTQDNVNTWITLMKLQVDYIGTDKTTELTQFVNNKEKYSYQNTEFHQAYISKHKVDFAKVKKPKNVILLIGDGMGLAQIYAGYTANKGQLNMLNIPTQGLSITYAADSYITDSAAGATAMATGHKSNNRYIGVDSQGKNVTSITQQLAQHDFKTAIISSGNMTDATPASFYAHQLDRSMNQAIAFDFLSNPSDILIGGGLNEFTNQKNGQNVAALLTQKGYTFLTKFSALDSIKNQRFVVLDNASVVPKKEGRGNFLEKALTKTLTTFSLSKKPFFIIEEGAQIDHGGHKNDLEFVVRELLDFDKLVGLAMEYVDKNPETLLIITADHETGGLSLIDGNIDQGYVHGNFSTNDHTAIPVPVFAYGPGAENFKGTYQNTAIFTKIQSLVLNKK